MYTEDRTIWDLSDYLDLNGLKTVSVTGDQCAGIQFNPSVDDETFVSTELGGEFCQAPLQINNNEFARICNDIDLDIRIFDEEKGAVKV